LRVLIWRCTEGIKKAVSLKTLVLGMIQNMKSHQQLIAGDFRLLLIKKPTYVMA